MPLDRRRIAKEFAAAVNMTAAELHAWLKTDESRKVGWKGPDGARRESVGHASGRTIVDILGKPADLLTDEDFAHMRKVVGFVRRHRAQEPVDIFTSRWRYSLKNWGHDPLKSIDGHG